MKKHAVHLIGSALVLVIFASGLFAAPSENFKVFLCFGQSNMSGGSGVNPDAESQKTNPRILALAFANCSSPSRTANKWSVASEPMHCGDGISAMGPSFAFAQALIDSLPPTDTIGLIPCGLWGVSIEMFMKGKTNTSSSKPSVVGNNAWDWMITKCKAAIERGVFSGIILHQGESNSGQQAWASSVKTIYDGLKTELGLTHDVPLVAGELLYSGCCKGHNDVVAKIPQTLPFGYVASASGLAGGGSQSQYHFNQAGYRTMGQRMAAQMVKGLREVAKVNIKPRQRVVAEAISPNTQEYVQIYSLDGKFLSSAEKLSNVRSSMRPGSVYIVSNRNTGASAKLMIGPLRKIKRDNLLPVSRL